MAIHSTTVSLLRESLPEFLSAAEFCVGFRKDNRWGNEQVGGCLGYPATALMFCIADSIGSYHRGKLDFSVPIDGKRRLINNDSFHHFFIFNSEYYGLTLTESTIKKLYNNYRNLLLHNAALAFDHVLFIGDPNGQPFILDSGKVHGNVPAFLHVTQTAVARFLEVIDSVVPGSEQERDIVLKK